LTRRTDLALEARELFAASTGEKTALEGVKATDSEREGFPVTTVEVLDETGAKAIGKPVGKYVTLTLTGIENRLPQDFDRAARAVGSLLRELLPGEKTAPVLVAGLGNRDITPDCIGPGAVKYTFVTRHLVKEMPDQFGTLRPVSAVAAGVTGSTGVESGELLRGVVEKVSPACVIAADALASRSLSRVCTTVQIADSGIVPGSGVGNSRAEISRATLGVPVIAVGVPTIVDAATLASDVAAEAGQADLEPEALRTAAKGLLVTPRDIDAQVAALSRVVGLGISLALQDLELDDLTALLS